MQPVFTGWQVADAWMDACLAVSVCSSPAPATCFFLEGVKEFSRRKAELGRCLLLAL